MTTGRVCVLYAGGTVGMVETPRGLEPREGLLETYLEQMPELRSPEVPQFDLVHLPPLLDSADMRPEDWVRIAAAIVERRGRYVGYVVLHGTDTMAYTASALSFLLRGLDRPVVLTGSQLSLASVRSDGRQHIITSLIIAGTLAIPEVCIYFSTALLRGNRAQKIRNQDFVAFASGNLPPLARAGVTIQVDRHLVRHPGPGLPREVALQRVPEVVALRLFPGIGDRILRRILAPPTEAVVLETYGAGTFPTRDPTLLRALEEAVARDVVVVNCSQCHAGRVSPGLYAGSVALAEAGVVSGHDMTPEAALTKLTCLLGSGLIPAEVRRLASMDVAGELTTMF